jgi:hypothetical protein
MIPFQDFGIIPGLTFLEPGQAEKTATATVNAGDKGIFYTVQIPDELEGEELTAISFLVSTRTGTPSADLRLETDDPSTGKPTGTLAWAGADKNFALDAGGSTQTITLNTSGTVTAGIYHVCLVPPSSGTTPDGSNNYNITTGITNQRIFSVPQMVTGQATSGLTTTGGRSNYAVISAGTQNSPPMLGFHFASGKTWSPTFGMRATNSTTSGGDVGGDTLRGNKLTLPISYDVKGLLFYSLDSYSNVVDGLEARFYLGNATTPFATRQGIRIIQLNSATTVRHFFAFSSSVRLEQDQSYRVMLACSTGAMRLRLYRAYDTLCMPFNGNCHQTRSTDGGASWSDANSDFVVPMDLVGTPVSEGGSNIVIPVPQGLGGLV